MTQASEQNSIMRYSRTQSVAGEILLSRIFPRGNERNHEVGKATRLRAEDCGLRERSQRNVSIPNDNGIEKVIVAAIESFAT